MQSKGYTNIKYPLKTDGYENPIVVGSFAICYLNDH